MSGTQSKLAAFGFFGEKPKRAVRGFEDDWEQEDDLAFDHEHDNEVNMGSPVQEEEEERRKQFGGLQAVPLPPPHPELRPAGLRELKRLEAFRSTRPSFHTNDHEPEPDNEIEELFPEIQPSSSSPGRHGGSSTSASTSSVTTEDELNMNSSAVAWWDELEDRRSSEFGSVPRLA
jgi:hypothetical protein